MNIIEDNRFSELVKKLSQDPERLVSNVIRILNSTDKAYKKLNQKNKKLSNENKHLKLDKDLLVRSEKLASINQFSMGMAHEINNPISFIISNLNTLKTYQKNLENAMIDFSKMDFSKSTKIKLKDLPYEPSFKEQLKFILEDLPELIEESLEGANRIKHIVKELMSMKNPNNSLPQYANINPLIDSCISLTYRGLEHKVIIKKSYENLPDIKCYPNKLKQVILNLIINSADAITDKGEISITTKLENKKILIIFSDTGKGIKQQYLSKIFDPFFTTKEVGQGMGLGLSTAYSFIKLHNGEIEVESNKERKGTTFKIYIPFGKNDLDSINQKMLEL